MVVVSRVCCPATDVAGNHPAGAARPRGLVTARRSAVLHRDLTTCAVGVAAGQIAGELDASDRSKSGQHDARLVAAYARNPRVRVAVEPIDKVVPAVNAGEGRRRRHSRTAVRAMAGE